jgi:uncharacterized protein YcbK (DUF882 family)
MRSVGLAAFLLFIGSQGLEKAVAGGETRTITLHHVHTNEDITITYKKDGQFDEAALKKLNWFLRDWRKSQDIRMAPHLIDLLWEVQQEFGGKTIDVVCGFRSPETNAMLRSRSTGVARTSLHMQGKATDFFIPGVPVEQIRNVALRIQGGGVGYYPTSGSPFVHMDVGNVRHWPRMTRQQLVRVFPDGRTIHIPSDGTPLAGYQMAMADGERTLHGSSRPKQRNLLASLFGRGQDQEEAGDAITARGTPARLPSPAVTAYAAPIAPAPEPPSSMIPLPQRRPAFQVASLESKPAVAPKPIYEIASTDSRPAPAPRGRSKGPVELASLTPNQIINERGYWQGLPEMADAALAPAAKTARRGGETRVASIDPSITGSAGTFNRNDRVSSDLALAYAAQAEPLSAEARPGAPRTAPAVVSTRGATSVAVKPTSGGVASAADRLNDPWVRGVVIAPSVRNSLVTTTFGAPDLTALRPFLDKPATAVMMTFSNDPHLGMTTDQFTGNAVVFQATVTFGMRTAALE